MGSKMGGEVGQCWGARVVGIKHVGEIPRAGRNMRHPRERRYWDMVGEKDAVPAFDIIGKGRLS